MRNHTPADPLSGPLQDGEVELVQDDFYDSPIARISVFKTPHFVNEPVIAISLFDHAAVNERDDRRTIYLREDDLKRYLKALRKHKAKEKKDE